MTNITQLRTFFTVLTICLFLNSCAFLGIPWQLSAATTAGDILSIDKTGKSVSENVASIAVRETVNGLEFSWDGHHV